MSAQSASISRVFKFLHLGMTWLVLLIVSFKTISIPYYTFLLIRETSQMESLLPGRAEGWLTPYVKGVLLMCLLNIAIVYCCIKILKDGKKTTLSSSYRVVVWIAFIYLAFTYGYEQYVIWIR